MGLVISGLRWGLDEGEEAVYGRALRALQIDAKDVKAWRIARYSVDARKKNDIHFRCNVAVELLDVRQEERIAAANNKDVQPERKKSIEVSRGSETLSHRPVVVGAGPCGLFAAYLLAREGYSPVVLERGKPIDERAGDVTRLWRDGTLDLESNVLFGEGGAGTFSDGKLTTRSKDPYARTVIELFAHFGASADIIMQAKPHIGTDVLRSVVVAIREEILRMGGTFCFQSRLDGLEQADGSGALRGLRVVGDSSGDLACEACILATGHSARDVFAMLQGGGVTLEPKPFAVGVRIEHRQKTIDVAQYGAMAGHPRLGAAEYQLTAKTSAGRGVYSFCMCPGGLVVAAPSEDGGLAVNGMSEYARAQENANAAIIVQVGPEDYGRGLMDGIALQREMERRAFQAGGGGFVAPAQRVGDFMAKKKGASWGAVRPSYRPGVRSVDLWDVLPGFCAESIAECIPQFGRKIRGFDGADAVMIGVETRTSSPIRILRDESGQSSSCPGLYPAGEGAGYAGGIVSAAVDGLHAAEKIIRRYAPPTHRRDI